MKTKHTEKLVADLLSLGQEKGFPVASQRMAYGDPATSVEWEIKEKDIKRFTVFDSLTLLECKRMYQKAVG